MESLVDVFTSGAALFAAVVVFLALLFLAFGFEGDADSLLFSFAGFGD